VRARCTAAGIRVFCQEERTQAANKERAFAILRAKCVL
jgi:peptide chain release factor 1